MIEAPRPLDDRLARAIGIPVFGLGIPLLFDLYGPLTATDPLAWAGGASFVVLAWLLWHGNRWLLFRHRAVDWLTHPLHKIARLLLGIVLFTTPLTIGWIGTWLHLSGIGARFETVRAVTLMNVICVVFVAHVYETVLLVKDRAHDLLRVERLERARITAEVASLRAQVDPHFVFNCLNTLSALIEEDPRAARRFAGDLAAVTRALSRARDRAWVTLEEELDLVDHYAALLGIRFGDGVRLDVTIDAGARTGLVVPPASLQTLVENAVKHNAFTSDDPLVIGLDLRDDTVVVHNARRTRREAPPPSGVGLQNLGERVRLLSGRSLRIDASERRFTVAVPVLSSEIADA